MIRTPLRPLSRVLRAREKGENPDLIERENIRLRQETMRDKSRQRSEGRLLVLGAFFFCAFSVIGIRMGTLAASDPVEPRAAVSGANISANRADIVDRNGRIMATNLATHALYAKPQIMVETDRAAEKLVEIFPDLDVEKLKRQFGGARTFVWVKRKISPEEMQAVHDIGEPGLLFGQREMRLYPNGHLAAHILGGTRFGREGVHSAEVIGTAGIEKFHDDFLRDPALDGKPLQLSIDLTVQAAAREVLSGGIKLMNAKGGSAVLMDIHSGEIVSMQSLPDFDPNNRPRVLTDGYAGDSPLFNRAVQGVYELGSVFKIFTTAQALELGIVNPSTEIDTKGPLRWGRHRINDFRDYGPKMSLTDVIVKSSNIGTANVAIKIGAERQQEFLGALGLFEPAPVELIEASGARPLLPRNWSEISTMTISYGHGLSVSPLHLAVAYSSVLNGGTIVKPTLLRQSYVRAGARVVSPRTSEQSRRMLRQVVVRGTASFGEVKGYAVGGKTGTADKPRPSGGYYDDKVISTFATVFPAHDPKYVLIVTLDEPSENSGKEPRRTAGWTAVPVAAEMIRRIGPLLDLRPELEPVQPTGVTLVSQ
jgi:cell division protein FtsI (penicillin-binding protein 3)